MDNCSISQNPAKSWEVGRGCALGFCVTEEKKHVGVSTSPRTAFPRTATGLPSKAATADPSDRRGAERAAGHGVTYWQGFGGAWLGAELLPPREPPLTTGTG